MTAATTAPAGWVYSALFVGMYTQRLIDPGRTPSGRVIADSLRRIVDGTVLAKGDGQQRRPTG